MVANRLGKRIVVHVGLPKTGSTSIQTYLAENNLKLEMAGCKFPLLKEKGTNIPGEHSDLIRALHSGFNPIADEKTLGKWQREIDAFIENNGLNVFVISHENFGMPGSPIDYRRLNAMFRGLPVEVVVFLRSAEEWITSLYEQRVRGGRDGRGRISVAPGNFATLRQYMRNGYELTLKELAANFPGSVLRVLAFDDVKKSPGIVAAFMDLIQCPKVTGVEPFMNERLTTNQIAILRALNDAHIPDDELFIEIRDLMRSANKQKSSSRTERVSLFPEAIRARIAKRFDADIKYVKETYGVDLPLGGALATAATDPLELTADKVEELLAQLNEVAGFPESKAADALRALCRNG